MSASPSCEDDDQDVIAHIGSLLIGATAIVSITVTPSGSGIFEQDSSCAEQWDRNQ